MRKCSVGWLIALVSLVGAAACQTPTVADIVTGPLQRASTGQSNFKCMVVNAGTSDANFTIEIRDQQGVVRDDQACTNVAPGKVCSTEAGATSDQIVYCRVSGVAPENARVTLCWREGATCAMAVTAP